MPRRIVFSDGLVGIEGISRKGYGSRAFMTRKTKLYKSENALSFLILVRPLPSKKHIHLNVVANGRVFCFVLVLMCT